MIEMPYKWQNVSFSWEMISTQYANGCTTVIPIEFGDLFCSRTLKFYSITTGIFSRDIHTCLRHACWQLFRAKIFDFGEILPFAFTAACSQAFNVNVFTVYFDRLNIRCQGEIQMLMGGGDYRCRLLSESQKYQHTKTWKVSQGGSIRTSIIEKILQLKI